MSETQWWGALTYELGTDNDEQYIRIAANPGGGRCSNEWVLIKMLKELLKKAGPAFSSTIFRQVFVSKSTNNAGFLAAILKAEKVIGPAPDNSKKLTYLSFERFPKKKKNQKTGGGPEQEEQSSSSQVNAEKSTTGARGLKSVAPKKGEYIRHHESSFSRRR